MPELLLHVGHGKTGSSYLQAAFRLNRAALRDRHGIDYPRRREAGELGVARITSGNGTGLLASEAALAEGLARHPTPAGCDSLFSSEFLSLEIEQSAGLGFLPRTARAAGYSRVRILLFVRDPLALAASLWQQEIKRRGSVRSVEAFFRVFDGPTRIETVLGRLEGLEDVEVTVRNYSRCHDRLLAVTADWLGLPPEALPPPPVARINRSLTAGELALQRAVNQVLGASGELLADPLCETVPEIDADEVRPPLEVQEATWARLLPAIERVNARLPEAERYRRDLRPPAEGREAFEFTAEQLEAIAGGLGGEVRRLRETLAAVRSDPARSLSGRTLLAALVRRARLRLREGRAAASARAN